MAKKTARCLEEKASSTNEFSGVGNCKHSEKTAKATFQIRPIDPTPTPNHARIQANPSPHDLLYSAFPDRMQFPPESSESKGRPTSIGNHAPAMGAPVGRGETRSPLLLGAPTGDGDKRRAKRSQLRGMKPARYDATWTVFFDQI